MPDANDLVRAIKKAANDANDAGYPVSIMAGTVTSVSPLLIKIEQRLTVGTSQLLVPEHLTDHEVVISSDGLTDKAGEPQHQHGFGNKQTVKIYSGLKMGEHVVLVRQQGGQKFLILDRVV